MKPLTRGTWTIRPQALAAALIAVALVMLVAWLAGAQKPNQQNVFTVQQPALAMYFKLVPGKTESELELHVRTDPSIKVAPEVAFQDTAGGAVRAVEIAADGQGAGWVGTITKADAVGVGYIHVTATTDSGQVERHKLQFANRVTAKNQGNVMYSGNGQFAFAAFPGDLPADTRFLITTLESPDPPLPAGVKLEAGPFQIMTTAQQVSDEVKANVAIFVVAKSPNNGPLPNYQVRWLKRGGDTWEALPTTIGNDGALAQASVSRLGTFVLTSEAK